MTPKVERKLTLRTRLPLILLGILVVVQLIEPDRTWMALLVGIGFLVGFSYLWAREMRDKIDVERQTRGNWIVAGDRLEERFQLVNRSSLSVLWATVEDHSDLPDYHIGRVVAAASRGRFEWRSEGVCTKRGVFTLGPWSVSMGDPVGLFNVVITYPEVRSLMVYPRIMHLPEFELPRGQASGRARHMQAGSVEAILPSSVRAYSPGDSLRLIHWRKTAQYSDLMVKEFEIEPAGDLWLVLDLDAKVHRGDDQESTLEYAIILAASLAARYLNENRAVGLVAFGQRPEIVPPQPSSAHLWRLLQVLAHAEPDDTWPLHRVLKQVGPDIGRGRTLMLITPSTSSDWLGQLLQMKRRDVASAALLLDAESFENGEDEAIQALRSLLTDYAIPNHVVSQGYPFQPMVTIKRTRTVLKTLSGFGRVIAVEVEEEV